MKFARLIKNKLIYYSILISFNNKTKKMSDEDKNEKNDAFDKKISMGDEN